MILNVISSESKGNGYILQNKSEALILEAGVKVSDLKKALDFNISKVKGVYITHNHLDHAGFAKKYLEAGLKLTMSMGTFEKLHIVDHYVSMTADGFMSEAGNFKIIPFDVEHDAAQPLGFYINHPETGNILFATDTYFIKNTFKNMNHILCEVNYSQDILDSNVGKGLHKSVRDRIMQSHMSLETFKDFLRANDLSQVRNIVLLHLSSGNSDAKRFQKEIAELTGKNVIVADSGMSINLDLNPF